MQAGWLTDLTKWLWDTIKEVFQAFTDFMQDFFVHGFEQILKVILFALSLLPLPDFMKGQSIGSMLAGGGSTVLWFADIFQIGPSMVLIGVAIIFYLLRRVLTLGIW
jgi:hypothetical protein